MKNYDRAGTKTETRASATDRIIAGNGKPEDATHPNYHVRVAYHKSTVGVLPEQGPNTIALFKDLCPNIAAKCFAKASADNKAIKENQEAIAKANAHNDKMFDLLAEGKAVEGVHKLVELPAKYNALPIEQYAGVYGDSNKLAREFLTRLDVCYVLANS